LKWDLSYSYAAYFDLHSASLSLSVIAEFVV